MFDWLRRKWRRWRHAHEYQCERCGAIKHSRQGWPRALSERFTKTPLWDADGELVMRGMFGTRTLTVCQTCWEKEMKKRCPKKEEAAK